MPEPDEKVKKPARKTRAELEGVDAVPYMPPLDPDIAYLYETLMDVGPVKSGGMGAAQLEWVDLQAWQYATGIELEPWEARLVRTLSGVFIAEGRRAEGRDAAPPWDEPMPESRKQVLADRDHFRRLAQQAPQQPLKRRR